MDAIKEAMIRDEDENGPPVAAHTPGPWTNEDGLVNGIESRKRGVGTPSLDIFDAAEWPHELQNEALANARLIAAAPEMLAALICAVNRADENLKHYSMRDDDCAKDYAMCVAAIAKATAAP